MLGIKAFKEILGVGENSDYRDHLCRGSKRLKRSSVLGITAITEIICVGDQSV